MFEFGRITGGIHGDKLDSLNQGHCHFVLELGKCGGVRGGTL